MTEEMKTSAQQWAERRLGRELHQTEDGDFLVYSHEIEHLAKGSLPIWASLVGLAGAVAIIALAQWAFVGFS